MLQKQTHFSVLERKDTATLLTVKILEDEFNVQQVRRGSTAADTLSEAELSSNHRQKARGARKTAQDYVDEFDELVSVSQQQQQQQQRKYPLFCSVD